MKMTAKDLDGTIVTGIYIQQYQREDGTIYILRDDKGNIHHVDPASITKIE